MLSFDSCTLGSEMLQWKTAYKKPGVRYREHPSRKHHGKPDRYYVIRYKVNGKTVEEALGWASQGMTAEKAFRYRNKLREAQRTGVGAQTLREQREIKRAKLAEEAKAREEARRNRLTFGALFKNQYFPLAQKNKSRESTRRELSLFQNWISPIIGNIPLKDITVDHLERIKSNMLEAGKSPRSVQYALAVIRQVFNFAKNRDLFEGTVPTSKVKAPKIDNRRERFLTHEEAKEILAALKSSSQQMYEIALVSLNCGLRAGEIFKLTWGDLNLRDGLISIRDTKTYRNRKAYMTNVVKKMFKDKENGEPQEYVFHTKDGKKLTEVPAIFRTVIKRLGLNDGIIDRRQKVVFHTLRHTFASWLVENGVSLYVIKELLGHSTIAMAERYSHLSDSARQKGVAVIDKLNGSD